MSILPETCCFHYHWETVPCFLVRRNRTWAFPCLNFKSCSQMQISLSTSKQNLTAPILDMRLKEDCIIKDQFVFTQRGLIFISNCHFTLVSLYYFILKVFSPWVINSLREGTLLSLASPSVQKTWANARWLTDYLILFFNTCPFGFSSYGWLTAPVPAMRSMRAWVPKASFVGLFRQAECRGAG